MFKIDYGDLLKIVDIPREYRPTHATNILIRFSKPKKDQKKVVDLGCGVGISSIMIHKVYNLDVLGIDVDEKAIDIGRKLVENLNLGENVVFLSLDVNDIPEVEELREEFDLVVSNPPHHFEGRISPDPVRESVRRTSIDLLEGFVKAAFHLLKNGGETLFIVSPFRLTDFMNLMRITRLEPKILIPVYGRPRKNCELIVLKGRKNGKPGLIIKDPIFLSKEDENL